MTRRHVYSPGAAADLKEIARYTVQQWGAAQARNHIQQLETDAADVSAGTKPFKDLGAIHPGLRSVRSGSHFIFCLLRDTRPPVILAILHERMDLMARLGSRL